MKSDRTGWRARHVKSEDNLADIGTKALSNRIIGKHAIPMGCVDVQENLRSGDVMVLWVGESEQEDQSRSAQQKTSLESTGGHARQQQQRQQRLRGSRISPSSTKRANSNRDVSPSCGPFPHQRIVTVSFSLSYFGFLKNWFVVSTKFLADDDVVVVDATESEAAVSWHNNWQNLSL